LFLLLSKFREQFAGPGNGKSTTNKGLSSDERKRRDPEFKKAYEKSYKELLFSELIVTI
jgi:hypothetical protein